MGLQDHTFKLSYGPSDDRLHGFYIPALQASVRYDRMTGFFTSSALAVAAAGVAHLIAGGGQMRLLVGAQLKPEDVHAIREGHDLREVVAARLGNVLPDPETLADQMMRDRLATLAWMVATGALEIRAVLPKGPDGLPLPASEAHDYFHPKVGVFTDAQGDQIAFSGSVNESVTGWQHNYEQFMVFRSWTEEGQLYVAEAAGRFERLWSHREPDWISLPVPEAARQRLLRYSQSSAPSRDPLEHTPQPVRERVTRMVLAPALQQERVVCQFLHDAPYLVRASGLGAATCALAPWPHQQAVARQLVQSFPARYLLADEVGVGKTIEAGLALRQLWLSRVVRRALILAPKSVLRQWQEELYEKLALNVPIYDGAVFRDVWGDERAPGKPNPWNDVELTLASSQLVKRRDRQQALVAARPWDLVIVDEAHHARRRDFLDLNRYRPNRLLELLNQLQARTRGLILMTATPMQVHPIEVWDLLNLLGLSGDWGADGRYFLRFHEQLRRPDQANWSFIFRMLRSELAMGDGELGRQFAAAALRELGPVDWERVCSLLDERNPERAMRHLPPKARVVAVGLAKRHTPLRRLVFRNTRPLLREYVRQGLLQAHVPHRDPRLVWITMRDEERALYGRIEEYISQFYRKYESERKGLGFVMTVYRRRLTSSFYAAQRSLERRLAFLRGQTDLGLDEDDLEQETLSLDVDERDLADRSIFRDEITYVEDFLHALSTLSGNDSKVERLLADLHAIFHQRGTAIVFTQYTDTMDYLREQLRESYGKQVACYSGRGGERWDGVMWVPVTKEEIKNTFREGKEVKILLCTEAASEGINLQTCGVLINYDMPWNPMRVEQRIGRVDRIGQEHDEVWIHNYFYEDTVEARVYQALSRRINWFQDVVGPLQPILAQVGRTIQTLAMVPEAERQQALREELERIQADMDNHQAGFDLDEWARQAEEIELAHTPVTLPEMAAALTTAPTLEDHFRPHDTIPNAFWLEQGGREVAVTFDPTTFDAHPNSLQLLTFGNPLLDSLLSWIPALDNDGDAQTGILRVRVESPLPRVAYYAPNADGHPRRLDRLADVRRTLEARTPTAQWSEEAVKAARRDLQEFVETEWGSIRQAQSQLAHARQSALEAQGGRLLLDAALVELALGQQPDLFGEEAYPVAFDEMAVVGLKRHRYPWAPLLEIARSHIQSPRPTDPFFIQIQNERTDQLKRRFQVLTGRAERLLEEVHR